MATRLFHAVVGLILSASLAMGQGATPISNTVATPTFNDPPALAAAPSNTLVDAQGDPLPPGAKARLGSTRYRLSGNIAAAAMSPDGKWIVSSNNGNMLTLSDPKTGKEIKRMVLPGPSYGANMLAFAPDGKNIAILGYSPILQIVSVPAGKLVATLQVPQANNNRVSSFAFSGDGKVIVAGTDNFNQAKNFVHAWDVATGKPIRTFEVMQNSQVRGALSRDGALLATSGFYNSRNGMEQNPEQGRTIQLWDVRSGKELRKVKIDRNQIMAVAMSPDSKTFAVASGAATFHLFETDTGRELRRFAGRRGQTQLLQFSPDGKTLVAGSADGTVQLWEAGTGKRLGLVEASRQRLFSISFPAPGQVWALGLEGQALTLWDAVAGKQLSPADGHMSWVRFLAYAEDGKTLMSGGADGKICWWDAATNNELRHHVIRDDDASRYNGGYPPGMRIGSYAVSHDGKFLAAANDYGQNTIRLYEMPSGKVLCDFDAPRNNGPSAFAFSPDNTRLAAIGFRAVHVWNVITGQELASLPFKTEIGNNNNMSGGSLVFSPDGKILAGARSYYELNTGTPIGEVYLWKLDKSTEIARIEGSGYQSGTLAFSPNGQLVALPMQNRTVMLLKTATGRELGRLEGGQANFIQGLAFSPDGRLLAGGQSNTYPNVYSPFDGGYGQPQGAGNRILIWELASGQVRQEFTGQGSVSCFAFSPDGRTLASGSSDTTVVLWDISGRRSDKFNPLAPENIEKAWNGLAEKNGKRAYQDLMTGMISSPEATLEVLSKNLQPVRDVKVAPEEIERLIAELDNDKFAIRVKATTALERLGDLASPALHKAQLTQHSLESQRRLKGLLERLEKATLPADEIRLVRAVEVLEKIGSPQAVALLRSLADGTPEHRLTVEARAALQRLHGN